MDRNRYDRLSNFTLRHNLRLKNSAFNDVLECLFIKSSHIISNFILAQNNIKNTKCKDKIQTQKQK